MQNQKKIFNVQGLIRGGEGRVAQMVAVGGRMAFSEQENVLIKDQLRESAYAHAMKYGVRKTSVDQLADEAGISKGTFYKFYPSKEMVFLEVLAMVRERLFETARKTFDEFPELEPADRIAKAVIEICLHADDKGIIDFVENDAVYIMRRVPGDIASRFITDDVANINALMQYAGLEMDVDMDLTVATVHSLLLLMQHKEVIGARYEDVLEILVYGFCHEVFGQSTGAKSSNNAETEKQ